MRTFRLIYKFFLWCFISFVIVIIGLYTNAYFEKPIVLNSVGTYYLYDDNNDLIYQGNSKNKWVSVNDIPSNLKNAVIAVEDKNFYNHNGFDFFRIFKAIINNLKSKKIVEGASTISQQYIKNAYLDFDKKWSRKIKEALMTLNLEVHYKKDEILEAYLNTINYGQGNYGIGEAAEFYFNKNVYDLSLEECILLAGIPKSPKNYNPVENYDNSLKRAKVVARAMYNNKMIDYATYSNLFKNDIKINNQEDGKNLKMLMYYHDAVIEELKTIDGISNDMINSGSLKVYTSLNLEAQKTLEKEINSNLDDDKLQVAGVIINPLNGSIIALTGGRDYSKSQYNRALHSKRQVGSTMKPFLYYSALENGMTSSSTFLSQHTTFNLGGGQTYSPKNWANIYGNKEITMAAAIAYSDNIYAIKTNLFLGTEKMINTAHTCGIDTPFENVASLALGTTEINLVDFAVGYTTFASGGYKKNIHLIDHIEDKDGNLIYKYKDINNLVLNPNYVYILNEMLTSTTNSSFIDYNSPTALSIASKMKSKYALKTGTTDSDYWIVGYDKNMLMVMWNGYDDNSDIPVAIGSKSKNIWANVLNSINHESKWFSKPENVVGIALDATTGKETNDISKTNMFYYLRGSEPV